MKPDSWRKALEVFEAAVVRSAQERVDFLDVACARDPEMRAQVEQLLEDDLAAGEGNFLEPPQETVAVGGPETPRYEPEPQSMPEVLGNYRILRRISVGGMGSVYEVETLQSLPGLRKGGIAAIKVFHPHLLVEQGSFKRFLREAEVGRQVHHPNVVRVLDLDAVVSDGQQFNFIVMEYVEGQSLRGLLEELGQVSEDLCLHIATEISKGLGAIHTHGIIHRDIKPENIQITPENQVKVMDLGVAFFVDEAIRLSREGEFVGSIKYAAPEQFKADPLTSATDLYSLGVTLYELSTGTYPYSCATVQESVRATLEQEPRRAGSINPQISVFFEEILHSLLQKRPEQRISTAKELAAILEDGERSHWWQKRSGEIRSTSHRPLRRIKIRRETQLHGRAEELSQLKVRYELAKKGDGQVTILEGEAGIGKSRLVDELGASLQAEGEDFNFLYGSYPPGGPGSVLGAVAIAIREYLGAENLEESLGSLLTGMDRIIPALAAYLNADAPPLDAPKLTGAVVHDSIAQILRALAVQRPTLLFVDDLHNAPEEGLSLFAQLVPAIADARVLLIGSARSGQLDQWITKLDSQDHVHRQSVQRLGAKELVELLEDALHSRKLAEELGGRIALKSDGNPYFAFEILRSLRDSNLIESTADGTWKRSGQITGIDIPSSVRDLIHLRLFDLSEDDRDVLELAACIGFEFDPLLVSDAMELNRIQLLRRLGKIERHHRVVRATGRMFTFDQHQLQELLYEGIPGALREEYHGLLGETLERNHFARSSNLDPATADLLSAQICQHLVRSNRKEASLPHLGRALSHLERTHATGPVLALTDRALESNFLQPPDRVRTLMVRGRALIQSGDTGQAQEILEEALRTADEVDDLGLRAEARGSLGDLLFSIWCDEEAGVLYQQQLDLAVETGDVTAQAKALINLGTVQSRMGQNEAALAHHEKALAISKDRDDSLDQGRALEGMAAALLRSGKFDQSRDLREEAIRMFRKADDAVLEASATTNQALYYASAGDYEEAARYFERGAGVFRSIGDVAKEAICIENMAKTYLGRGFYGEAIPGLERALAVYRDVGNGQKVGVVLTTLGTIWIVLGDFSQAKIFLEEARSVLEKGGFKHRRSEVACTLGFAFEQEGDLTSAKKWYESARELCPEDRCLVRAEAQVYLARLELQAGNFEAAGQLLDVEIDPETDPDVHVLRAVYRALIPGGSIEAARDALQRQGPRMVLRSLMEAHFVFWKVSSEREHIEESYRILRVLHDHAPEPSRPVMLREVNVHREIVEAWERVNGGRGTVSAPSS